MDTTKNLPVTPGQIKDLHKKFVALGRKRHKLSYQLLDLLPEINRQRIWEREGYQSIFHYAAYLAGLSRTSVEKALNLDKKLKKLPKLRATIKKNGVHKVAMVANLATPETDAIWADKTEHMSFRGVEILSKEIRAKKKKLNSQGKNVDMLKLMQGGLKCKAASEKMKIELDDEMQFLFFKLKKKMGNKLSNKEVLRRALKLLTKEENFSAEKFEQEPITEPRYIKKVKRQSTLAKTNGRCDYPGCNKPIEEFHHKESYAISRNHSSLTGVCKIHHEFDHSGVVTKSKKWELKVVEGVRDEVDKLYRSKKMKHIALGFHNHCCQ
ncbi:hypothetical protein GF354_04160 [Candidatus Peregrinibacteria bacterium]|nr:hypothetical protein [Candidatus Peregrinibacteria bacterium]